MCKRTEKLIELIGSSKNPTDIALVLLAQKIDELEKKIDTRLLTVEEKTKFARWLDEHKSIIKTTSVCMFILATFGISVVIEYLKKQVGL